MKSKAAIGSHPIHPMLVPIPIGAFFLALVGDVLHTATPADPFWYDFSFTCLGIGLIFAVLAAAAGAVDYLGVKMSSRAFHLASWHAVLNAAAVDALRRHLHPAPQPRGRVGLPLGGRVRPASGGLRGDGRRRLARRKARVRAPRRRARRAARALSPAVDLGGVLRPRAVRNGTGGARPGLGVALERFSLTAMQWAGSSWAFGAAVAVIAFWAVTGPIFHYSDTWQLVINTGTTIVTFLMVFLIQRAQNKESKAIQLKLNEIVAAIEGASNRLIDVEGLSEAEIDTLHEHYSELAKLAGKAASVLESHSIEEARGRAAAKVRGQSRHRSGSK